MKGSSELSPPMMLFKAWNSWKIYMPEATASTKTPVGTQVAAPPVLRLILSNLGTLPRHHQNAAQNHGYPSWSRRFCDNHKHCCFHCSFPSHWAVQLGSLANLNWEDATKLELKTNLWATTSWKLMRPLSVFFLVGTKLELTAQWQAGNTWECTETAFVDNKSLLFIFVN